MGALGEGDRAYFRYFHLKPKLLLSQIYQFQFAQAKGNYFVPVTTLEDDCGFAVGDSLDEALEIVVNIVTVFDANSRTWQNHGAIAVVLTDN